MESKVIPIGCCLSWIQYLINGTNFWHKIKLSQHLCNQFLQSIKIFKSHFKINILEIPNNIFLYRTHTNWSSVLKTWEVLQTRTQPKWLSTFKTLTTTAQGSPVPTTTRALLKMSRKVTPSFKWQHLTQIRYAKGKQIVRSLNNCHGNNLVLFYFGRFFFIFGKISHIFSCF